MLPFQCSRPTPHEFPLFCLLRLTILTLLLPLAVGAQSHSGEDDHEGEAPLIKTSRVTITNPAEFQKAGVLQLEYGYDAYYRARNFRMEQASPLTLRFAATDRLLLALDFVTFISERHHEHDPRETSVGDTRLGFQVVALKETPERPALSFAYYVKLPTGNEEKELSTGRVDHRFVALTGKKFGKTSVDFNAALLRVGRPHESGSTNGGQAALAISRSVGKGFGVVGELAGQTRKDVQPSGLYALGLVNYHVGHRLSLDAGMRFGLNPEAPPVGVVFGITVGLFDFYNKH
ncbi:MAG: transporter [Acidobacteria bacterium]|nr:transporter [Acidobacteriota bacterium]